MRIVSGLCGPSSAGTQRKRRHTAQAQAGRGRDIRGCDNWQAGTSSLWDASTPGSVACDVRENHSHGAGQPWHGGAGQASP